MGAGAWTADAAAAEPAPLEIAAGFESGAAFAWAAELAARVAPPRLLVQPSNGSVDSLEQLAAGRADLAVVQGDVVWHAVAGNGRVGAAPSVVALGVVHAELVHVVVRQDVGITSIGDLEGRRVAIGAVGTGTLLDALDVLAAYGVTVQPDFTSAFGLERVAEGSVDAAFNTATAPWPRLLETPGLRVVPVDLATLDAAPYYRVAPLPDAYGPGSGLWVDTLLVAHADLDPAVATAILDTGLLQPGAAGVALHPVAAARFGRAPPPEAWTAPGLPDLPPPAHRADVASSVEVRPMSAGEVVAWAVDRNPAVRVASLTARVEDLEAQQAMRAFVPILTVSSGLAAADGVGSATDRQAVGVDLPTGTQVEVAVDAASSALGGAGTWGADATVTVEQALLEGADLDLGLVEARLARLDADRASAAVALAANELVATVLRAYADLAAAHARVSLQEAQVDLAARHLARVRQAFDLGREGALAVDEASFAAAEAERDRLAENQALGDAEDVLLDLLQARFAWRLVPVGDVRAAARAPLDPDDTLLRRVPTAIARRPDLHQMAVDLQKAKVALAAARNRALPSLGAWAAAGRVSDGSSPGLAGAVGAAVAGGAPFAEGGVSLGLPLGPTADGLGLEAARLAVVAQQLLLEDKVEAVTREVRAAWRAVAASRQRFEVAESAADLADRKLSATLQAFRRQEADSFKVLSYQADLLEAQLEAVEAAADVIRARAELDRVTGVGADAVRAVVDRVEVR